MNTILSVLESQKKLYAAHELATAFCTALERVMRVGAGGLHKKCCGAWVAGFGLNSSWHVSAASGSRINKAMSAHLLEAAIVGVVSQGKAELSLSVALISFNTVSVVNLKPAV